MLLYVHTKWFQQDSISTFAEENLSKSNWLTSETRVSARHFVVVASRIIHTLLSEWHSIIRDSDPIRLLETPASLSVTLQSSVPGKMDVTGMPLEEENVKSQSEWTVILNNLILIRYLHCLRGMSVVSLTSRFANVPFANVLRRFANVFSPILMVHCRDSNLHFFNWQQFICFPKCYHIWFPKFI